MGRKARNGDDCDPTHDEAGALAERHSRLAYLQGWDACARAFYEVAAAGAPPALAWKRCNDHRRALWRWATGDTGRLQDPPAWPGH
jgi:hypothetical protein